VLSDELHFTIVAEFQGNELNGTRYVPLFGDRQPTVVLAEFVSTAEGTGIVHIAPAFGEDDFNVAKGRRPSSRAARQTRCRFDAHLPLVGGLFFTDANAVIMKSLASRAYCTNARCTNIAIRSVGVASAAHVLCAKGVVSFA